MIYMDKSPSDFTRVYDLNSNYCEFHSDKYTYANFTFVASLYWIDASLNYNLLATKKLYPQSNGYCWVNPSDIFKNYLSPSNQKFDLNPSATGITEASNSIKKFQLTVAESYGTPPVMHNTVASQVYMYNGCQQFIPYDSVLGGGNSQWVMYTGTTSSVSGGTGNWLTDTTEAYLSEDDYYFLYFINPPNHHIDFVQYKFYYPNTPTYIPPCSGFISVGIDNSPPSPDGPEGMNGYNSQSVITDDVNNITPSKANYPPIYRDPTSVYILNVTGLMMSATGVMWYIPIGLKTLRKLYPGIPTTWLYYTVDIKKNSQFQSLNKNSFYVRRTNRDTRYNPYYLTWFNNHGGWDFFCFDKGSVIKEKEKRDTFAQNLQPGYNFNQSGNLIYNMNPDEEITLTTSLIEKQSQSQILVGLFHSTSVFVIFSYIVNGVSILERGYEQFVEKITKLGGEIKRL